MRRFINILVCILIFYSCDKKNDNNLASKDCMIKTLKDVGVNGKIEIKDFGYEIILASPYKTVHESHQKLLTDYLLKCITPIDKKSKLTFKVYLDKEKDIKSNNIIYSLEDAIKEKDKYDDLTITNMHEYILQKFDKKDIFVMNRVIKKFNEAYTYKEDIYNVDFLELLRLFREECKGKTPQKATRTLLLIYGTYKDVSKFEYKSIGPHIKEIWSLCRQDDIQSVLDNL